jgi:hypothetical protein
MNPQTEPSVEGSALPKTTSSISDPASGHSIPNKTAVNENLQDDWSSSNTFCNAAGSFLDPVSLLFGKARGDDDDDDDMPGETLLADESVASASSSSPGDGMSPVADSVEEKALSPGYQKRGRFLVWPTSLGGPMGFPLGLRTN